MLTYTCGFGFGSGGGVGERCEARGGRHLHVNRHENGHKDDDEVHCEHRVLEVEHKLEIVEHGEHRQVEAKHHE